MGKLKLDRLKETYDFEDFDEYLTERYVQDGLSSRELAEDLNIKLTNKFFEGEPFEGELVYQVYNHPDEIHQETETKLKERIDEAGINIDKLRKDWTTHRALLTYLNRRLDVDTSKTPGGTEPEETMKNIEGIINQGKQFVSERLKYTKNISEDKWEIQSDIRLIDKETGESVRLLDRLREAQEELDAQED
jgi:chorismate mutase